MSHKGLHWQIAAGGGPFPLTTFLTYALILTQKETPFFPEKHSVKHNNRDSGAELESDIWKLSVKRGGGAHGL
jgi:hypothetical protein